MPSSKFFLSPASFTDRETTLVDYGSLSAQAFRFQSGVQAVRIQNELGELVLLPFQGQQIWSAHFLGRDLTMRSMFDQPRLTRTYLETYGGFLIHCGMTAMGVPGAGDTHPLHGELPNAPYQSAWITAGEDEQGSYLELGGQYQHTIAFNTNYSAQPYARLYAGKSTFWSGMTVTNLKNSPMDYMYLAHINFRPVDNACLVYSAPYDSEHVRVRTSIPSHIHPLPGYREFLDELAAQPEKHHLLAPGLAFDPEVVFFIDYSVDVDGWAHTLQVHPDGAADYVRHRPDQLSKGVRWICRTADQDALGMILPATAEPEGLSAETAKGNVRVLGAGEVFHCDFEIGALSEEAASKMERMIHGE